MDDEKNFSSIIDDLTYPFCPRCKSKQVAISRTHSACLGTCGWIGPTTKALNNNLILKSILAQEGYINLTAMGKNSLKFIAMNVAKEKSFPGATDTKKDQELGAARCFIPRIDEHGEEVNIQDYLCDRSIKTFRLGTFNFMEKISALMAHTIFTEKEDPNKRVSTSMADSMSNFAGDSNGFLTRDDGSPNPTFFRKKSVIDLSSAGGPDSRTKIKVYSAAFGRPDTTLSATYTSSGGLIEDNYPTHQISNKAMIWQPFYWPSLKLDNSEIIRLVGVLQNGNDNINYVATESMDTGSFRAGVYKRSLYEPGVEYVESKATDIEEAIRRLRTSFEKTVVRHQETGDNLDLSWIEDWNYEYTPDMIFYKILNAPFWEKSVVCEMFHLIGRQKEEILDEMYHEVEDLI